MAKLKRYIVTGELTISVCTEVIARSPEEAKEQSARRGVMTLCSQCAGSDTIDEEWVLSADLDGEPQNLRCGP